MPKFIDIYGRKKLTYATKQDLIEIPNLIEVQRASYRDFLQANRPPQKRARVGLQEVFMEIFPIQDFTGNLILEFVEYRLGLGRCKNCPEMAGKKRECLYYDCPHDKERECAFATIDGVTYRIKYDPHECKKRDVTYGISLQLVIRLINKLSGEVKQQEIFLVSLPIMTDRGTFIINGAERVVVSQLHRSPGAYYKFDRTKKQYLAKIIPYRGAWLEYELDLLKETIHVRIDRKRKQPVTVLLKALGLSVEKIQEMFGESDYILNTLKYDKTGSISEALADIYAKLRPGEPFTEENAIQLLTMLFFDPRKYDLGMVGRYKLDKKWRLRDRILAQKTGETMFRKGTGEIMVEPGEHIDPELATRIEEAGLSRVKILTADGDDIEVFNERADEVILLSDPTGFRNALLGKTLAEAAVDVATGEIIEKEGASVNSDLAARIDAGGMAAIKVKAAGGSVALIERAQYEQLTPDKEELIKHQVLGRTFTADAVCPQTKKPVAKKGDFVTEDAFTRVREAGLASIQVTKGRILTRDDVVASVRYLIDLCNGIGHTDDIDHLGSRRVRRVGELLQNQFRMSLIRMEREIKERMTIQDAQTVTTQSLINARPVAAMIKDFFGSSQLSQFMDQTNPLSELTHKRRISALGPGGVKRERAGYEIRDVHPTHWGRICPIETPEGPNAGLISSLTIYSIINDMGFIESPYCKVEGGKMTGSVKFMDAYEEDEYRVTPADTPVDAKRRLTDKPVTAKFVHNEEHEFAIIDSDKIDFIQVSPLQMVSIASALIPFLEHDDANRALMGTNMQRQAVPLVRTEVAYVGTGLEVRTAKDSGCVVVADNAGKVVEVDANHVVIERGKKTFEYALENHTLVEDLKKSGEKSPLLRKGTHLTREEAELIVKAGIKEVKCMTIDGDTVVIRRDDFDYSKPQNDRYELAKFSRSNQGTCINQKPLVKVGQKVERGDVLADGPATCGGELALGRNILGVFMPWEGYNYEDAILISESLVKEDLYTSIHIEEYEIETRDTRLGVEEITRDIPNISAEALRNLDEEGIIRIGAEVESGDILVGKVTPKGETELTSEDKLLRAIFGEKAREVRNTSFVVPHGESGKVVDVMVFSRENKDELPHGVNKLVRVFIAQKRKITEGDKMAGRHGNKGVIARIMPECDMPFLADGRPVQIVLNPLGVPSRMNLGQVLEMHLGYIGRMLGFHIETPIFEGATEDDVKEGLAFSRVLHFGEVGVFNPKLDKLEYVIRFENSGRHRDAMVDAFLHGAKGVEESSRRRTGRTEKSDKSDKSEKSEKSDKSEKAEKVGGLLDAIAWLAVNGGQGLLCEPGSRRPVGRFDATGRKIDEIYRDLAKGNIAAHVTFPDAIEVKTGDECRYIVVKNDDDSCEMVKDRKRFPSLVREVIRVKMPREKQKRLEALLSACDFHRGENGKQLVYDGRSGMPFDNEVTVGWIYMMKLAHLVDDKIHARATGPYSLVTQQPLGGKAQFGGQRFGEMEVWALEAYGVAHTLQELLTVKSDDIDGRVEVYEAIIKGENVVRPSVPESFKVLLSELQSLGLKVDLMKDEKNVDLTKEEETEKTRQSPLTLGFTGGM